METVRDILAAHRSGISRPGLLAWARLRIDTAMTEAQLEEELARLGDEVVDDEGFLYLRSNLAPGRLASSRAAAEPAWGPRTADDERPAAPTAPGPASTGTSGGRWPPKSVASGSEGCGGCIGKLVGLAFVLVWAFGLLGGILEGTGEATPTPAAGGVGVAWTDLAVGECFTFSEEVGGIIRRLPCDQPHGYEMIEIATHPGAAFPGESAFASFAEDVCNRAFAAYTGAWPEEIPELTWAWWSPTEREWNAGIRTIDCMLAPADGSLVDRSYRDGF